MRTHPDTGAHEYLWAKAQGLTEFCIRRGAEVFRDWPIPTLFAYVFFHLVDRTAFGVRANGEWQAIVFADARPARDILALDQRGAEPFNWRRSVDHSDGLLLGAVIGSRDNLPALARQVTARWPDWAKRRIFAYRDDSTLKSKLVELGPSLVQRMIKGRNG